MIVVKPPKEILKPRRFIGLKQKQQQWGVNWSWWNQGFPRNNCSVEVWFHIPNPLGLAGKEGGSASSFWDDELIMTIYRASYCVALGGMFILYIVSFSKTLKNGFVWTPNNLKDRIYSRAWVSIRNCQAAFQRVCTMLPSHQPAPLTLLVDWKNGTGKLKNCCFTV